MIPYSLISTLHSDYSDKFRFLYVPPATPAHYRSEGLLDLPVGSALVKTFSYPASDSANAPNHLLETRLLVHTEDGWQARVYIWNREQTQAHYKVGGKSINIDWLSVGGDPTPLRYRVPNLNQCKGCHSKDQVMVPIGPRARNLDFAFDYDSVPGFAATGIEGRRNQLKVWAELGALADLPRHPGHRKSVSWGDRNADLQARARAYLDINCGHCHQPGGAANSSGLFLNLEESRRVHLGIGKKPTATGRASGGRPYSLVPGQPEQSILLYRMQSDKPGTQMPEISLTRPHAEGIELIRDWIMSLR